MWQKQLVQRYPVLGSSQDPEKISLAVQAGAVALLPFLTLILSAFRINTDWLKELVNTGVGLVSAGLLFYGVVRKFKK